MKFLLFAAFIATISCVNAGKTARLLAAMNAGLLNGMIGGGLNPALMAGGGVGLIGQPQLAQFVPGVPALGLRAPLPNVIPAAAVNGFPFMGVPQMAQMNPPQQPQMLPFIGVPQMAPMNPPQQPQMGMAGGAMQQQAPLVPDPIARFRRQIVKSENTLKSTVDTQIPAPESTTVPPCNEDNNRQN